MTVFGWGRGLHLIDLSPGDALLVLLLLLLDDRDRAPQLKRGLGTHELEPSHALDSAGGQRGAFHDK